MARAEVRHGERQKEQDRRDEEGPDHQRQTKEGHPRGPHVDDRGNVVDRAEQGRNAEHDQADDPEILPQADARVDGLRRQRRVSGPAGRGGSSLDEEAAHYDHAGHHRDPERQHVDDRKGHVARTDHQRDQEVTEASDQNGHDDEKDHDRRVHREERVVELGRNDAAVHVGLGNPAESPYRRFGPGQLPPHQKSHQPS